jgi:hypothetical protein
MRTIVVIGVPWSTHELSPAVRDAASLDARLCVVDTPETLAKIDSSLDLDTMPVQSLSVEVISSVLGDLRVDSIVSLTEMTLECAAQVREALGHGGTPAVAERSIMDKALTRKILKDSGLTDVEFWETSTSEVKHLVNTLNLPLVLKPRALTGSTGVRLLRTWADVENLETQYAEAQAASFGRDRLLLESFVPGEEVSVEGMVVKGEMTLLTITDKINTGPPHFFEVGHVMPSRHTLRWKMSVRNYLKKIVDALGIITSPIHAELKLSNNHLELIEIHSRFGGDNIVRLLEEALGLRPFEIYFAAMLEGRKPDPASEGSIWGVGFFTAMLGHPFTWNSFNFPHAQAVAEIDFDRRRLPKLREYEGVKILYWRLGQAFFTSPNYREVYDNVDFMAEQFSPRASSGDGEGQP